MPKTKRTRSTKKAAKRPTRNGRKVAVPPRDDPLQRHEESNIDRMVGAANGQPGVATRAVKLAAAGRAGKRTKATAGGSAAENGEVKKTARMRLAALEHSRGMRLLDEGRPVSAAAAGTRAESRGAGTVAPVPGISNWVQMGPTAIPNGQTYSGARVLVTGRITAIVIDPTNTPILYVGTAQGGVWKSTDGGKTWSPKMDNEISLAIGALAMDPSNPLVLYAGTGEGNFSGDSYYGNGVLKTINGGTSWTPLATGTFSGTRFGRIAVTPGTPTRLFGATGNGLYRSTDGGVSWTLMAGGLPSAAATDVAIDSATPTTVYAAFWGQGIYRSTNAGAAAPTWTKLAGGLPAAGITRIGLAISPSSPLTVYALTANAAYTVNGFCRTTDGGSSWTAIALPGGNIGGQGFYNLNVAVDPTTPDIVYLSGISLWKATRNPVTGAWSITDVGGPFHPDNHALAIDPTNHLVLYAGSDGGIYSSADGGATWSDAVNSGLCITQFEFMAQHPTSDAVVFCGTQDNGTEQFRNSPVFYHADDGDGGATAVDQIQPRNVLSTYYGASPKRSILGGAFGSWSSVSSGLVGSALFYPPMALDETNPNNIAFGTDRINLDTAQGTGGWPTKVLLPGITGNVSAIHYVNSSLLYAGTTTGQVYRLTKSGASWTAYAIHAAPLPGNWIWEIRARPDNANTVIVAMSGFSISHVWRGAVPASGTAAWTNISGSGAGTTLPDIPVNALMIDPLAPDTYYIGTDVAVYRTLSGGTAWTQFSQGLPNCAVFDMRLHPTARVLRVATHGRGMWERRLDVPTMPNVNLFVRDHLMDTGRSGPSPSPVIAAFDDPLQHVALGDTLYWWMCADIKVDALEGSPPSYQMNVADVDYVAFENKLSHRNPQRGRVNRVYVQFHNRGIQAGAGVTVKLLFANASAGLPPLPADFWTAFPGNSSDTTNWKPIGVAKTIASLSPTEPAVLEWDWKTPSSAADHSCLLVVIDSPTDPIPAANKVFDVNLLVPTERRVGLKNLHVVDAPPGTAYWTPFQFFGSTEHLHTLRITGSAAAKWGSGLLFPKPAQRTLKLTGISRQRLTPAMLKALREKLGRGVERFDTSQIYLVDKPARGGVLEGLRLADDGFQVMLLLVAPPRAAAPETLTVAQQQGQMVLGGSTFVLRTTRKP